MAFIEIRLRPSGPWRTGHSAGERERVDTIHHSDAIYSAVTLAMQSLGWLEEWLLATARVEGLPAICFSSWFPYAGAVRLVPPPRNSWPPAGVGKLYLDAAKLVPLEVALGGDVDENRWSVDGESGCLLPTGESAPFSAAVRSAAAVDRFSGASEPHRTACLEFAPNAGWWGLIEIHDAAWEDRVKAALRLLADSGFGGERSRGWGRAQEPRFSAASPLFTGHEATSRWWLLSLYSPDPADAVDWTSGDYTTVMRSGWTGSMARAGAKKHVRMVAEGSVLVAPGLRGRSVDVAPEGFPHPVYRSGFALAVPAPGEAAA